jgi:hypothetical protein
MNARHTAAGLLASVALAASAGAANASPVLRDAPRPAVARHTSTASLLHDLRLLYADTHQRSAHNEIVLVLNDQASAVL